MRAHTRPSPRSFLKMSSNVSSFYGFRPLGELERVAPPSERLRGMPSFTSVARLCGAMGALKLNAITHEPVLVYYATANSSYAPPQTSMRETGEFGLAIIGSQESMGEILLIKVIAAIFEEWGTPISSVRINALGDRDSQQRFTRELSTYFRKHTSDLEIPLEYRSLSNTIEFYKHLSETHADILTDAPRSVNFLSERSRVHFRTILEHLETLSIPYQLDYTIMSDEREQRILFAIDLADKDLTIVCATGGRYDDFIRRITGRKESAGVQASIFFRRQVTDRSLCTVSSKTPNAKVYLVQLGPYAKLHGLAVVDMLRTARVPTLQSFDSNHLANQLTAARHAGVSHVFIMGQREVLDGTIIVRSADERTQSTITLSQLPRYLKTLRA